MTDVIEFHHAQGRTPGVLAFADTLRAAGHPVAVPDLYDGATFDSLQAGVDHAEQVGFDEIIARGVTAAEDLPPETVYIGFSLGVMPAQKLVQTRTGAKAALLIHSCVPTDHFGCPWPQDVPLQIHTMDGDEWGDVDIVHQLAETIDTAELFLYPGDRHLFTDSSLPDYDQSAAALLTQRVLDFLDRVG
ncbi:dienelactone hydrolase [Melghirimyces profundicolus]|uniref:Dienelactone hydrolase n=1 Tax=Melghirimyces profundicolus TaxID=1242148 RepID=A0A2T6BGA3_9BACL|nr:dienelactone hydrolase family protein [Melghirimyces profundicolus]PTX55089.1 dienelactone hydrolase [Melghirimyces profundicolus]